MSSFIQHLLFAVIPCVISGYVFFAAQSMPASARLLPQMMSVLSVVLAALMVINAWRDDAKNAAGEKRPLLPPYALRCAVYAVGIAAYIYAIEPLGYFPATALFMMLSFLLLRAAGVVKSVLITAAFCGFIYALFVSFLKLPVPLGLLETFLQ